MHNVELTLEAQADMQDIALHIQNSFGDDVANEFADNIERIYEDIAIFPLSSVGTTHTYRNRLIYLNAMLPPSLIFYVIDEPINTIYILRVLRKERKWENLIGIGEEYHRTNGTIV